MNTALARIIDLLSLEPIETNLFRGQNDDNEHVFGGQVLGQAIRAAAYTVPGDHALHSLHAYFLRPGDWTRPILYDVDRIRDGRSFITRRVNAIQKGEAIFSMSSSWHVQEQGLEHAATMPNVPGPEGLISDAEAYEELARTRPEVRRFASRFEAIESRQVERILMGDARPYPPYKHTWMRAADTLPDEPAVHWCLLGYMSDMDFMSTSMLPHGVRGGPDSDIQGASLDHSMWFHRPFRADQWLLFAKESPNASAARGFVRGQFFDADGRLVVSAAQECLIRPRRPQ